MERQPEKKSPLGKIKLSNAIYPILIGLGVVGYMLWRDFDPAVFAGISFTWHTAFWLLMAVLFMFGRDLGYMIRIRVLSGGSLNWRQAFRVIMLWEFTSAITPSAVGGTSVAILYVHKEGISVGRSSAIVMLTSFLDEVYFIVMFPLLMLIVGRAELFDVSGAVTRGLMSIALAGYFLKLAYVLVLSYGLFVNPRGLKWLILKIFRIRFLRRWYHAAGRTGSDIVRSSHELRRAGWGFWLKAGSSTFLSWSSRYLVANALIMAFFSVSDQFLLFARQLVMWIMMLIMPTPGGSGFAEYVFSTYCRDLIVVPPAMQLGAATLIAPGRASVSGGMSVLSSRLSRIVAGWSFALFPLGNGSERDLRIPYDFPEIVGISAVAETFPDRIRTYPTGSVFCLSGVGRNIVKRPVRSDFRPAYPLPAKNFGDASADELFAGCGGRPLSLGEQGLGRQHIDRRRDLDVFVRALA